MRQFIYPSNTLFTMMQKSQMTASVMSIPKTEKKNDMFTADIGHSNSEIQLIICCHLLENGSVLLPKDCSPWSSALHLVLVVTLSHPSSSMQS